MKIKIMGHSLPSYAEYQLSQIRPVPGSHPVASCIVITVKRVITIKRTNKANSGLKEGWEKKYQYRLNIQGIP